MRPGNARTRSWFCAHLTCEANEGGLLPRALSLLLHSPCARLAPSVKGGVGDEWRGYNPSFCRQPLHSRRRHDQAARQPSTHEEIRLGRQARLTTPGQSWEPGHPRKPSPTTSSTPPQHPLASSQKEGMTTSGGDIIPPFVANPSTHEEDTAKLPAKPSAHEEIRLGRQARRQATPGQGREALSPRGGRGALPAP